MANYYNMTAWKHTGFDYRNRPYSRDVLNTDYFLQSGNYIQVAGLIVKRDDTSGLTYIDLQGSVKDIYGEQVNSPNITGSQGPGGPWYSWEEVDYIRLARTGYPGDDTFIDISGHEQDPWNAPAGDGKPVYIGYYFVVGLEQVARNVTRMYLECDYWLTMGGADELEIETGYKIRGPITDAEDAASYNESAEGIGLVHPLITIGHQILNPSSAAAGSTSIIVSATDIAEIADGSTMDAFTITDSGGNTYAIPKIVTVNGGSHITLNEPDGTSRAYYLGNIGLFDPSEQKIRNGLAALYSAGQLDLADSYIIPGQFVAEKASTGGQYSTLINAVQSITPTVGKDITTYPRKADYMFGSMVLYNVGSGSQGIQKFSEVDDATVNIWASLSPTGNPYARFKSIKSHPYIYDQAVAGMAWIKNAVVMQGASGSIWSQINYAFQQGANARETAQNTLNRLTTELGHAQTVAGYLTGNAGSALSTNTLAGGIGAVFGLVTNAPAMRAEGINYKLQQEHNRISEAATSASAQQNAIANMKANNVAPFADFIPDINKALFTSNEFGLYVINTDSDDRARLREYFNRYGYAGLYKPLTWANIHVKTKVNFIQCEGVVLKHSHYPLRDTTKCAQLLEAGLFLWDERPNAAAFSTQTDATQGGGINV